MSTIEYLTKAIDLPTGNCCVDPEVCKLCCTDDFEHLFPDLKELSFHIHTFGLEKSLKFGVLGVFDIFTN